MAVCGGLAERHSFGLVRSSFCVMERAPERRFVSAVSGPGPSIAGRASGSGPHPLSPNREPGPRPLHEWNRNHRLMIEPTMSDTHAQYEPVAWWFTRRRLGRELRNRYQVPEELPARLLTLISELDGKPEVSLSDDVPALDL